MQLPKYFIDSNVLRLAKYVCKSCRPTHLLLLVTMILSDKFTGHNFRYKKEYLLLNNSINCSIFNQ